MSASKSINQRFGFSTGALERGNFRSAVSWLVHHHIRNVELSALRYDELEPLVDDLDQLPLGNFDYVSLHAPSAFTRQQEHRVVQLLQKVRHRHHQWNIIVHPDVIYTPSLWSCFGEQLLIENMDRRKASGRTADELDVLFHKLPKARLCLDVAHARQMDSTLTLLAEIISRFSERIAEVHVSELDSSCRHRPLSWGAVTAYRRFSEYLASSAHVIIESSLDKVRSNLRMEELDMAEEALGMAPKVSSAKKVSRRI